MPDEKDLAKEAHVPVDTMQPQPDRITVQTTLHHQCWDDDPTTRQANFTRVLTTVDEEALTPKIKFKAGQDPVPLDTLDVSLLQIKNTTKKAGGVAAKVPQVVEDQFAATVLVLSVQHISKLIPIAYIRPGEVAMFEPVQDTAYVLGVQNNAQARASLMCVMG